MKQTGFFTRNWTHDFSYGGSLRKKRAGRGVRPLSTKEPLHLVFKVNRERLVHGSLRNGVTHTLVHRVIRQYAKRFFVKIEQVSVQADHCHLLIRAPRRSQFHYFFRVVAGQIAQRLEKEGLLAVASPRVTSGQGKSSGENARKENLSEAAVNEPKPRSAPGTKNKPVTDTPRAPWAARKSRSSRDEPDAASNSSHDVTSAIKRQETNDNQDSFDEGYMCSSNTRWYSEARGTGLWKHRPFSRVVRGYRAYTIVRDYIQLNELEAQGRIPFRKNRLRGLSAGEWEILWS